MYKGEDEVLRIIAQKKELDFDGLVKASGLNPDSVRRIVESLKGEGFAEVTVSEKASLLPCDEFASIARIGAPEFMVFKKAAEGKTVADLTAEEKSIGLSWARKKGLVSIENGVLKPAKSMQEAESENRKIAGAFESLLKKGMIDDAVLLDELFSRKLVKKETRRGMLIRYSGKPLPESHAAFDISAPCADAPVGQAHVVSIFMDRVRQIMAELGFEEMDGPLIESTFWNFDALFQPQDHPARDLADTFYLEGASPLPGDKALVSRIKAAHKNGWKYAWKESEASRIVLRTHTTALSARYLSLHKDNKPKKFFAVGKVFRNEATDFKHLAEFHQVEGIISWEGATFRDLLGVIREFYGKLGFKKIRFRPSFFPYTEPSLEIEVFFERRAQWLELGGAGIFRPEVSIPLAGVYPILAWGLSLERPLMLLLGLEDIRAFYRNDIDFLKDTRLKI